jgi:hypothetical protein
MASAFCHPHRVSRNDARIAGLSSTDRLLHRAGDSLHDPDKLQASGRSGFDEDRGLAALEVLRDQRDQFRVRLAVHRRRLQLRHPGPVRRLRERGHSRSRSDFDLNDPCRHGRRSCHSQRQRAPALAGRGRATRTRSGGTTLRAPDRELQNSHTVRPPEDAGLREPWSRRGRPRRQRRAAARSNLCAYR